MTHNGMCNYCTIAHKFSTVVPHNDPDHVYQPACKAPLFQSEMSDCAHNIDLTFFHEHGGTSHSHHEYQGISLVLSLNMNVEICITVIHKFLLIINTLYPAQNDENFFL